MFRVVALPLTHCLHSLTSGVKEVGERSDECRRFGLVMWGGCICKERGHPFQCGKQQRHCRGRL